MKKLYLGIAMCLSGAAQATSMHNIYAEAASANAFAECKLAMQETLLLKMSCRGDKDYGVALARAVQQYSPREVVETLGNGRTFKSPGYREALASPFEMYVALHPLSGTSIERGLQATGDSEVARLRLQVQSLQGQLVAEKEARLEVSPVHRDLASVRSRAVATVNPSRAPSSQSATGQHAKATHADGAQAARKHERQATARPAPFGNETAGGRQQQAIDSSARVAAKGTRKAVIDTSSRPLAPRVYIAGLDAESRSHLRGFKYREFDAVTHDGASFVLFGTFAGNEKTYSAFDNAGIKYAVMTPHAIKSMHSR